LVEPVPNQSNGAGAVAEQPQTEQPPVEQLQNAALNQILGDLLNVTGGQAQNTPVAQPTVTQSNETAADGQQSPRLPNGEPVSSAEPEEEVPADETEDPEGEGETEGQVPDEGTKQEA